MEFPVQFNSNLNVNGPVPLVATMLGGADRQPAFRIIPSVPTVTSSDPISVWLPSVYAFYPPV